MKKTYLILTVVGTFLPNIFVVKEGIETQNYFLYTRPIETISQMFTNNINTTFTIDLLYVVIIFLSWTILERKKFQIKGLWMVWAYTFILGLAGALPLYLYLYLREVAQTKN